MFYDPLTAKVIESQSVKMGDCVGVKRDKRKQGEMGQKERKRQRMKLRRGIKEACLDLTWVILYIYGSVGRVI